MQHWVEMDNGNNSIKQFERHIAKAAKLKEDGTTCEHVYSIDILC